MRIAPARGRSHAVGDLPSGIPQGTGSGCLLHRPSGCKQRRAAGGAGHGRGTLRAVLPSTGETVPRKGEGADHLRQRSVQADLRRHGYFPHALQIRALRTFPDDRIPLRRHSRGERNGRTLRFHQARLDGRKGIAGQRLHLCQLQRRRAEGAHRSRHLPLE